MFFSRIGETREGRALIRSMPQKEEYPHLELRVFAKLFQIDFELIYTNSADLSTVKISDDGKFLNVNLTYNLNGKLLSCKLMVVLWRSFKLDVSSLCKL